MGRISYSNIDGISMALQGCCLWETDNGDAIYMGMPYTYNQRRSQHCLAMDGKERKGPPFVFCSPSFNEGKGFIFGLFYSAKVYLRYSLKKWMKEEERDIYRQKNWQEDIKTNMVSASTDRRTWISYGISFWDGQMCVKKENFDKYRKTIGFFHLSSWPNAVYLLK